MPDIVPTRVTAYLETELDPITNLPGAVLSVALAQRQANGTFEGVGTRALELNPLAKYDEIDPRTGQPTGRTLSGARILAVLLGLAKAAQRGHP